MNEEVFKQHLHRLLSTDLQLVLQENRTTMLHILAKKKGMVRLSVHRMFLQAPEEVIRAIAHYVQGSRKGRQENNKLIRDYIHLQFPQLDYTSRLDRKKLDNGGRCHNLLTLYQEINQQYFKSSLDLSLTWFGKREKLRCNKATFGLYQRPLRLIKVHRLLDQPCVPDYFVSYILYHEMLHHVIPSEINNHGHICLHGPEFKKREREYHKYDKAIKWEKQNQDCFFL